MDDLKCINTNWAETTNPWVVFGLNLNSVLKVWRLVLFSFDLSQSCPLSKETKSQTYSRYCHVWQRKTSSHSWLEAEGLTQQQCTRIFVCFISLRLSVMIYVGWSCDLASSDSAGFKLVTVGGFCAFGGFVLQNLGRVNIFNLLSCLWFPPETFPCVSWASDLVLSAEGAGETRRPAEEDLNHVMLKRVWNSSSVMWR